MSRTDPHYGGRELMSQRPKHVLPPIQHHSLMGLVDPADSSDPFHSSKPSDSTPSAYSSEAAGGGLQPGFGNLELQRTTTGTGTETSRVSAMVDAIESHAVHAR